MVHVLPHWNWAGHEGQPIPVMAYTNAEEVELLLNGKSLGRKKKGEPYVIPVGQNISEDLRFTTRYRVVWEVPYAPGTLKAVAYSGGKAVATTEVKTAGAPARLVLAPDRLTIRADGEDLSFVTVRIEDADGNLVPVADNLVRFEVEGAGPRRRGRQRQRGQPGAVPGEGAEGVLRPRAARRAVEPGGVGLHPCPGLVGGPGRGRGRPQGGVKARP